MPFNIRRPLLAALTGIVFFLYASCTQDVLNDTEILQATQLTASTTKTITLSPIQDAYLQSGTLYNSSVIRLEENNRQGYLMYDLSAIDGQITTASLEFTIASDPGYGTIKAYLGNGTNWTETNLSTQNKPATGALLGSINTSYAIGSTQKITLNAASLKAGKISLVLMHSNGNDLDFSSGETTKAPKLTVTYSSGNTTSKPSVTVKKSTALIPVQDAYLQGGTLYNSSVIRLEENNRVGYLMFDLSNIDGQITSASLDFTIGTDPGYGTIKAYLGNGTNWTETTLSSQNKPATGALLGSINTSYAIGAKKTIALNTASLAQGKISIILMHSNGNDLDFSSGETSIGPKLNVTYNSSASSSTSGSEADTTPPVVNKPTVVEKGYYVTVNGNANNNGLSEGSAWSLEHAIQKAEAGDVVYIKAGNYGNLSLVPNNSGTAAKPIKFIGYTNTPGDIVSNNGSTFNYGDRVDANKMPLLKGSMSSGRIAIRIQKAYVEIHNIQIQGYEMGIVANGDYVLLKNIITYQNGPQTVNSGTGKGIILYGNSGLIEDCFDYNSTSQGITLSGSNNSRISHTKVYSDNKINPNGYYILLTENTTNSLIEDCIVYRDQNADVHRGHGFVLKDIASNNIIKNSFAYNTGIEVNFSGIQYNTFENIKIYGSYSSDNGEFSSNIRIINGAHDNTFKDIYIDDCRYAINFHDFNDGYVGPNGDKDKREGGSNNKFINLQVNKAKNIIGATSVIVGNTAFSNNNQFTNCSFKNILEVPFFSYQTMKYTKFTGCSFINIPSWVMTKEYNGGTLPISFQNCTFSSIGFSAPN